MSSHDDDFRLPRRRLLHTTAAAALGWSFSPLAFARPTAGASKPRTVEPTSSPSAGPTAQPVNPTPTPPTATALAAPPQFVPLAAPSPTPEMQALAHAIAQRVKHGLTVAAAAPDQTFAKGSYAQIGHRFFAKAPAAVRTKAQAKASKLLAAPVKQRRLHFGPMANATAEDHLKTLEPLPPKIVEAAKTQFHAKLTAAKAVERTITKMPYKKIGFFLNEVECIEETDEVGADEILMAAFLVSPDGRTQQRNLTIHTDFDAGEKKVYYPADHDKFLAIDPHRGKLLVWYPLDEAFLPGSYTLMLTLWEQDQGGFQEAANELRDAIAEEAKLAMLGTGHALLGPIGVGIAELAIIVLSEVLDWLKNIIDNPDDHIDDFQCTLTLASAAEAYFAGLSGRDPSTPDRIWAPQPFTIKFRGDGGYYKAKISWRVRR